MATRDEETKLQRAGKRFRKAMKKARWRRRWLKSSSRLGRGVQGRGVHDLGQAQAQAQAFVDDPGSSDYDFDSDSGAGSNSNNNDAGIPTGSNPNAEQQFDLNNTLSNYFGSGDGDDANDDNDDSDNDSGSNDIDIDNNNNNQRPKSDSESKQDSLKDTQDTPEAKTQEEQIVYDYSLDQGKYPTEICNVSPSHIIRGTLPRSGYAERQEITALTDDYDNKTDYWVYLKSDMQTKDVNLFKSLWLPNPPQLLIASEDDIKDIKGYLRDTGVLSLDNVYSLVLFLHYSNVIDSKFVQEFFNNKTLINYVLFGFRQNLVNLYDYAPIQPTNEQIRFLRKILDSHSSDEDMFILISRVIKANACQVEGLIDAYANKESKEVQSIKQKIINWEEHCLTRAYYVCNAHAAMNQDLDKWVGNSELSRTYTFPSYNAVAALDVDDIPLHLQNEERLLMLEHEQKENDVGNGNNTNKKR